MKELADAELLYAARFSAQERQRKAALWGVLCRRFFQRYIETKDTVMDLGAGHCDFINQIECGARIAVDTNPALGDFAAPGVRVLIAPSTDLGAVQEASVDVVMASNFFEHLPSKAELIRTLLEIFRVLRPGGRLLVLQPNIRFTGGKYWDFIDHHLALTERSVAEALELTGFDVVEVRPRFLPYTTKSRMPQFPLLVRLYLAFPPAHRLLGEQAWVVGQKPAVEG